MINICIRTNGLVCDQVKRNYVYLTKCVILTSVLSVSDCIVCPTHSAGYTFISMYIYLKNAVRIVYGLVVWVFYEMSTHNGPK